MDSKFNEAIKQADFQNMLATMSKEVCEFYSGFNDSPEKISGWGHNWFCPQDGGRLIFDMHKPYEQECEICGKKYDTELFRTVWVYNYRNEAFLTLLKSAILYKAYNDVQFLKIFKEIFSFYMDHYDEFKLHDKNGTQYESLETAAWGCGKIMPQGLNESLIFIRATSALEILKNDLDSQFLDRVKTELIPKIFKLLKPQVDKIHNIPCWNNSAIGVLGLFAQNKEMIDFTFNGKFNINRQLEEGVTKEGFWYEGSIHYNYFTLEGVISLLLFADLYNQEFKTKNILREMLIAGYYYAFDNGQLPNPNDGWPNINLKTYSFIYTMGAKIFNDELINDIYRNIMNAPKERTQVPLSRPYYFENRIPLEHLSMLTSFDLTMNKELQRKSTLLPDSNFVMLRNSYYNVFCKYGHNGPSHAHPDKMTIEIVAGGHSLSRDLSNSGYGVALCNEWHRMTISHNTVVVNGENQISYEKGQVIAFTDNSFDVKACGVYSNHKIEDVNQLKESLNPDELLLYIGRNLHVSEVEAQNIIKAGGNIEIKIGDNNINYERAIKLIDNQLIDVFTVESDEAVNYDYFFHSEAKLLSSLATSPCNIGYSKNGYQHLHNLRQVNHVKDVVVLEWDLCGVKIESTIKLNGAELFICETPDNPIIHDRTTIILRKKAKNHIFDINWKMI